MEIPVYFKVVWNLQDFSFNFGCSSLFLVLPFFCGKFPDKKERISRTRREQSTQERFEGGRNSDVTSVSMEIAWEAMRTNLPERKRFEETQERKKGRKNNVGGKKG